MATKLTLYEKQNKGGTQLEFNNLKYVSQGRRSVCFEAEHKKITRIIKKLKCPTDHNNAVFRRAFEINRKLMPSSGNSVAQLYGYFYDDKNCPYIVAEKIAGKTLQETQFADLHALFKVFIRLSKAIHQVHEAGYLCIDLSPDNILVLPDNAGLFGTILFDFDSMVEFDAVRQIEGVASTMVFASPELVRKEFTSLCRQSDYYSLSSLLYNEIYGYFPVPDLYIPNEEAKPEYQNLLENSVIIREALKEFWKNTLTLYPEDRYQSYAELEAALVRLCDLTHSNAVRPIQSNYQPYIPEHYVRQEKELELLKNHFAQRKNGFAMAIIHSEVSGAGKTTLAHAFTYEVQKQYDAVEFCHWEPEKGFKGVLEQIKVKNGYGPESALGLDTQKVLIVIDNYDQETSEAFPHWGDKHHFLFTSRYCSDSFNVYIETGECCPVDIECTEARGKEIFHKVYTSFRELYIPASTQYIPFLAFCECDYLERVTIAAEKIQLAASCFQRCKNLREVELLGTEVEVDEHAFLDCNNLKRIVASKEWKENNIHVLERLPAYEAENEEERRMIEEYREDMQNPINALLQWSRGDSELSGEEIDEDAVRQAIRGILTDLGVDEIG